MSKAAKDLQWGCVRPAGRQFDMPDLKDKYCWTSLSAVFVSENSLILECEISIKAKMCLFICEFSISGSKYRNISTGTYLL